MSAPKEHEGKRTSQSASFFCLFFCPFFVFICYPKHKNVRDLVRSFRLPFFFRITSLSPTTDVENRWWKTTKQGRQNDEKEKKKRHTPSPLYIGFSVSSSFLFVCVWRRKRRTTTTTKRHSLLYREEALPFVLNAFGQGVVLFSFGGVVENFFRYTNNAAVLSRRGERGRERGRRGGFFARNKTLRFVRDFWGGDREN